MICEWQDNEGGPYCDREATHSFERFHIDLWRMGACMCWDHLIIYQRLANECGDCLVIGALSGGVEER